MKKGFTLIELLISMAILSIVGLTINSYLSGTSKIKNQLENKNNIIEEVRNTETSIRNDLKKSNILLLPNALGSFEGTNMDKINQYCTNKSLIPKVYFEKPDRTKVFYALDNNKRVHKIIVNENFNQYEYSPEYLINTDTGGKNKGATKTSWNFIPKKAKEYYESSGYKGEFSGANVNLDKFSIETEYLYNYTTDLPKSSARVNKYTSFNIKAVYNGQDDHYYIILSENTNDQWFWVIAKKVSKSTEEYIYTNKVVSENIGNIQITNTSDNLLYTVSVVSSDNKNNICTRATLIDYGSDK